MRLSVKKILEVSQNFHKPFYENFDIVGKYMLCAQQKN